MNSWHTKVRVGQGQGEALEEAPAGRCCAKWIEIFRAGLFLWSFLRELNCTHSNFLAG
jgi:hypothetical protein